MQIFTADDIINVLYEYGYRHDKKESSGVWQKYRGSSQEVIIVRKDTNSWWNPISGKGGHAVSLVTNLTGGSVRDAVKYLSKNNTNFESKYNSDNKENEFIYNESYSYRKVNTDIFYHKTLCSYLLNTVQLQDAYYTFNNSVARALDYIGIIEQGNNHPFINNILFNFAENIKSLINEADDLNYKEQLIKLLSCLKDFKFEYIIPNIIHQFDISNSYENHIYLKRLGDLETPSQYISFPLVWNEQDGIDDSNLNVKYLKTPSNHDIYISYPIYLTDINNNVINSASVNKTLPAIANEGSKFYINKTNESIFNLESFRQIRKINIHSLLDRYSLSELSVGSYNTINQNYKYLCCEHLPAYYDDELPVQYRGPSYECWRNQDKKRFSKGKRTIGIICPKMPTNKIMLFESFIDALAYAEMFNDDAPILASLGGVNSSSFKQAILKMFNLNPSIQLITSFDNDEAGESNSLKISQWFPNIMNLTNKTPRIEKDWNDLLKKRAI